MSLTWTKLTGDLIKSASERRIPLAGSLELTARCNLRCKMCYVCQSAGSKEAINSELTTAQWIKLAEEIRDEGALFTTLTGGEVLLRKDFKEIYENITQLGMRVVVFTNGTLITPELAKWFGKIPPSRISITLYGASEDTYEKVCGMGEGFNKVCRAIELLLAEGITVEVKTTITKGNVQDYDKMVDIANGWGLKLGLIDYVSPRREGCYSDPLGNRLSAIEMAELVKRSNLENPYADEHIADEIWKESDGAFRCSVGKWGYWISYDGRLIPCGLLNEPMAYPLKTGFHQAWETLKDKCLTIPICGDCKDCPDLKFCSTCPARLKAETGEFDKKATYLCEFTKESLQLSKS